MPYSSIVLKAELISHNNFGESITPFCSKRIINRAWPVEAINEKVKKEEES